ANGKRSLSFVAARFGRRECAAVMLHLSRCPAWVAAGYVTPLQLPRFGCGVGVVMLHLSDCPALALIVLQVGKQRTQIRRRATTPPVPRCRRGRAEHPRGIPLRRPCG